MKKTFQLNIEGKHPDRVLDAIKHETRQYIRRERGKPLAEGVDFADFDCRFGTTEAEAQAVHLTALTGLMDTVAQAGGTQCYVEILSKPGVRTKRDTPQAEEGELPCDDGDRSN